MGSKSARILFIEDDPSAREMGIFNLKKVEYALTVRFFAALSAPPTAHRRQSRPFEAALPTALK